MITGCQFLRSNALILSAILYFTAALSTLSQGAPLSKAASAMRYAETAPCTNSGHNPRGINLGNPCKVFSDTRLDAQFVGGRQWITTLRTSGTCLTITSNSMWTSQNQVLICQNPTGYASCRTTSASQCYCDASNPEFIIKWLSSDPSCSAKNSTIKARLRNTVNFLSACTATLADGSPCLDQVD